MLFEFITIYTICRTQCAEKSASFKPELQVQFINIASSKTRQLKERLLYTDIFRAPPRAERVALQRKTSVTIILNATFCKRCVSNKSAL
jgi:hypothetical protein